MKNNRSGNISVGNIPCNFFYYELMFYQVMADIYCWPFLPSFSHLFQIIRILQKSRISSQIMLDIYHIYEQLSAEVETHNSGKDNIYCLLYLYSAFQKQKHLKQNKGTNIIVSNIYWYLYHCECFF